MKNTTMLTFSDNEFFEIFVHPVICNQLLNAGLTPHTKYQWRLYNNITLLFTDAFDFDKYYVDGMKLQDEVNPPNSVLPAYTLKDVEKTLPNYLVTKTGVEYEISLEKFFRTGSHKSKRLPDAFALLLKELLEKNLVKKEQVNSLIYNSLV